MSTLSKFIRQMQNTVHNGLSADELAKIEEENKAFTKEETGMNQAQVQGMVRGVGAAIGGALVTLGYTSAGTVEQVIGVLVLLSGWGWSWYSNKTTTMISQVAASPKVAAVVVHDPAVAKADPNPKVISN